MASFNKVILMGNLTRDPQVRYTPGGTAVADIGLAVNRVWFDKQSNQKKEETTFVDVTLWGRQAEVAGEYLSKGRGVLIEGRLQLDTWDDKNTGEKRSKLKVVGEEMTMVGGRNEGGGGGGGDFGGGGGRQSGGRAPQGGGGGRKPAGRPQPREESSSADSFYDSAPEDIPDDDVPF
jgi:single-strand DNA-binding protein